METENGLPLALLILGVVNINMGNDSVAHPLLKEAQELFDRIHNTYFYATTMVHLGNVSLGLGKPQEALGWLEKAYPISVEVGDQWVISFALNNMGEVARVQGDYAKARKFYEQSEALLRSMGDKGDLARLTHNLGCVALHEEDFQRAETQFRESLGLFRRLGNKRGMAEGLASLASLCAACGEAQSAAHLLGAAEAMLESIGGAWWPADRGEINATRAVLQSGLGEPAFRAGWTEGRGMALDQALARVHEPGR
jgi:tetratricopeptide (TPR) repeat protein